VARSDASIRGMGKADGSAAAARALRKSCPMIQIFDIGFLISERTSRAAQNKRRSARAPNATREARMLPGLFEQRPQILQHGVLFLRARGIGEKELLAQVQCLCLHCIGTKPIPYRSQELIPVHLTFSRIPCVTNRSRIELIERYFRVPIELRDR